MAHVRYANQFSLSTLFLITTLSSTPVIAENDDDTLLNTFHKAGITKCDSFILKHAKLKGNWHVSTSRHPGLNNDSFKEMAIIQVTGERGDSVKFKTSFIQTPSACYVSKTSTATFSGMCSDANNINPELWYVKVEMEGLDYKQYENKGGLNLYAKQISVGNFNACVIDIEGRNQTKFGK